MPARTAAALDAKKVIQTLTQNNIHAECPCCEESVSLKDANLFYLDDFPVEAEEVLLTRLELLKKQRKAVLNRRKKIESGSQRGAQAVNIGYILERIAPSMPSFAFQRMTSCSPRVRVARVGLEEVARVIFPRLSLPV